MLDFLFSLPDTLLFSLLSLVFIAGSLISLILLKKYHLIGNRLRDNTTIGNISSLIGIIYGVLVGITALFLINNIGYTADAVQREANAVANIYRDSNWIKEPGKSTVQNLIKNYLVNAITVEWPKMEKGENLNSDNANIVDKIANEVNQARINQSSDYLVFNDMYEEIKTLYDAREQRIHMSHSKLNSELWLVILIGTVLTIGVNLLFKMSFSLHLITIAGAALMASSMIFLLITLDSPFQGDFVIEPDALQSVLNHIQAQASH